MNDFNVFRLITPSFFGTRNKMFRKWLPFEWTRWMTPFLNIASTSYLINSDSCIDTWAWCGTLSWNGHSWKSIFKPNTHSNIFGSFVRISNFLKNTAVFLQVESFLLTWSCVEKDFLLCWGNFYQMVFWTSMVVETFEMVGMMMLIDLYHSVHWGINPSSKTPPPSFLPSPPPLNRQTVHTPPPLFRQSHPLYWFFMNPPLP